MDFIKSLAAKFNLKSLVASVIAGWTKLPKEKVSGLIDAAEPVVAAAIPLIKELEADRTKTGWEKLAEIVDKLKVFVPADYQAVASTLLTVAVSVARLYTLLKK